MLLPKSRSLVGIGISIAVAIAGMGAANAAAIPTKANKVLVPESFGAKGDGVTDDTQALQKAFASSRPGRTLVLRKGKVYAHSKILSINNAGAHVSGPGTLLATNEQTSSVWINADNVTLDGGIVLKMSKTTKRWDAWEQMKLRVKGHSGAVVRNVTIDGSAAAGVYVGGASNFLLDHVTVMNTRADGIHMTGGANKGRVVSPVVKNVGDDGVAVVSYKSDSVQCSDITIDSPSVYNNTWGRGVSVIGGKNVTYKHIYVQGSSSAAVIVAAEDSYNTYAPSNVKVIGGTIVNANTSTTVDHGAVLVVNSQPGSSISNVQISGLAIKNTRASASRQVGILSNNGGALDHISLTNFTITGGPSNVFVGPPAGNSFTTSGWTFNGARMPPSSGR